MTGSYFEKKLWELLPPIYRIQDESGDLDTFLRVPAPTLDEIKILADRFPKLFDVDGCEPRFLPLLAAIVGHRFDPMADAGRERRAIREAVERYRRKGTIPAIRRSLVSLAWKGDIEETFRKALRLGQRARLNRQRLPGLIYSFGVWRIRSEDSLGLGPSVRAALPFHHPAGTRVFFLDLVTSLADATGHSTAELAALVRKIAYADARRVFVLNLSRLNESDRLTNRNRTGTLLVAFVGTTVAHRAERAATCISRWDARRPGFRMNQSRLGDRLENLWISDRHFAVCCEIDTGTVSVKTTPTIRFTGQSLNRARLNRASRACRFHFRQRDLVSEIVAGPRYAANLFLVIEWPAPPTVRLASNVTAGFTSAANLATATDWPT